MNLANLRKISNNYSDVRLVSLRTWKAAAAINPRDAGGPYLVSQEGYDPADLKMTPDEFLLGKSGRWITVAHFYQLPQDLRRQEYVFGTAAQVMEALANLPPQPAVLRPGEAISESAPAEADDLKAAFEAGRQQIAAQDGFPPPTGTKS